MRALPFADPGLPDTRSRARFLGWIAREQWRTLAAGTTFAITWMLAQALLPWAIGRGVDGMIDGRTDTALRWATVIAALGVVQALAGVARHRAAVANWLYAAFRVIQVVTRHTASTGTALRSKVPTGEVVATVSSDSMHIGHALEVSPRFFGSLVSYVVVSIIVLQTSVTLGLIVLIGVPALVTATFPIVRPLRERQRRQREAMGKLTELGADTVAGLRVLRGIGGEEVFARRYAERSENVRQAGVTLAGTWALLDALMVLLPGIFLVLLTWIGARLVIEGSVPPGALVALYGYAFFLVIPVRTAGEMTFALARATVAARRVLTVLAVDRDVTDTSGGVSLPNGEPAVRAADAVLIDQVSGLRVAPGKLTMLVSDEPAVCAVVADRLGRLVPDGGVTWGGVPLEAVPLAQVRRRIVVGDAEPTLFTGTLREGLDPHGRWADARLLTALEVAAAGDVVEALRDGLDSRLEERGRSLSGGQRQRVALARVLVQDPEVLVLVEPTSAVDAHTEAAIAQRLRAARAGRTTVVVTASPLLLAMADTVAWFDGTRVAAIGTHEELLAGVPGYRRTVTREEETV